MPDETPVPEVQPEQPFEEFETSKLAGEDTAPPAEATPAAEVKPSDDGKEPPASAEPPEGSEKQGKEDGDDPKPAEGEKKPPDPKPKHKGGFQKRIDKLTKERRETEAENAKLRQQLADKIQPAAKPAETPPAADTGEPKEEDFDTYKEYDDARVDWRVDQKFEQRQQKETEKQQEAAAAERLSKVQKQTDAVREKYPDYDEMFANAENLRITPVVEFALKESENLPALQYHLLRNSEEVERLNALPSLLAVAVELGKIEAQLAPPVKTPPATPKPTTSSAPPPVAPVGGGKAKSAPSLTGDMPYADYEKHRERQPV
jgi:hypothetical protein